MAEVYNLQNDDASYFAVAITLKNNPTRLNNLKGTSNWHINLNCLLEQKILQFHVIRRFIYIEHVRAQAACFDSANISKYNSYKK